MGFRTVMTAFALVAALPVAAFDATAAGEETVRQWTSWMGKHGISQGAIIVAHNGDVVAEGGLARSVDDPAKVASLSKAITAICALKAADASGLSASARLSDILPGALAEHAPRDTRFGAISLAHLMTHTSGLDTDYHRDELPKLRTFEKENKLWQFSKIAALNLSAAPGSAPYRYSNANYLILGLAIEEMTGEAYETYCQREVLAPAGVTTAKLTPDWQVMTSWGGWEISAHDYLRFVQANFTGRTKADRPAGHGISAAYVNDRGTRYSAGMLYRNSSQGLNAWHSGSWTGVKGRVTDRFGAYVAVYGNGMTVVTNYAHDAWDREIARELDRLLYNATHP